MRLTEKKSVDLGLAFVFILPLGFIFLGVMHEQVHVQIYRHYEIESHVDYISYFPHFATIPEKSCPSDMCRLAHDINEVVGYHLMAFYLMVGFGLLFIIILLELNVGKTERFI